MRMKGIDHRATRISAPTIEARATAIIQSGDVRPFQRVYVDDRWTDGIHRVIERRGDVTIVELSAGGPPKPAAEAPKPAAAPPRRRRCANCGRRPGVITARDSSGIEDVVCARCARGDDFERVFSS